VAPDRPSSALAAAIFDMDGLLVDSEPLWRQAEIEVFGRHGVTLTDAECRATKGSRIGDVARAIFESRPWRGPSPEEVAAAVVTRVGELIRATATAMPGSVAAVASCRGRGMAVALASSSPPVLIAEVLERLGLGAVFEVVHSATEEAAGKPDPAVFLTTARLLGVDPADCVVFEDAPAGVVAAKSAGMCCVVVPEQPADDLAPYAAADVVLGSLEELDAGAWARVEAAQGR
jgi:mannitol-1-/sugar-/sorbitol-6-/2-deoxyglucose-6-phosphatase